MKIFYLSLGVTAVGLGVAGIILPILPTTPFLLLATIMFSKSSDRLNDRFQNSKLYKKYLEDFIDKRIMTKKRKWTLLIGV
ncbi:MAG: YbaN family protein, partial [Candidatus Izemoplasmatales bacterium]|nr:YbaN family protein [Candidatus Izemoplasmatales bacterium]